MAMDELCARWISVIALPLIPALAGGAVALPCLHVAEALGQPAHLDDGRSHAVYLPFAGAAHGCFLTSPWHFRICSGEQLSGLPFRSFGLSHFALPWHIVWPLPSAQRGTP